MSRWSSGVHLSRWSVRRTPAASGRPDREGLEQGYEGAHTCLSRDKALARGSAPLKAVNGDARTRWRRSASMRGAKYPAGMRAVLVVNPRATSTTLGGRDVIAHALASELQLEVVETTHAGHAEEIAAAARREGVDLVVAHGGDGTVNEVVNGLLTGDASGRGVRVPRLSVVPGGSANVFARALGLPSDPVEATHVILDAIMNRRSRKIGLGMADGRWFTFSAGLGWDADVVAGVAKSRGKQASPALYVRTALTSYLRPPQGRPPLTIEMAGQDPVEARTAFISNTDPWTYLGPWPVRLNPGCSFDGGLGLFALRSLGLVTVLSQLAQALSILDYRRGRHLIHHNNLPKLSISCEVPVNFQIDGDLVGERTRVEFLSVPQALTVVL